MRRGGLDRALALLGLPPGRRFPRQVLQTHAERRARIQHDWLPYGGVGVVLVTAGQWGLVRSADPSCDRRFAWLLATQVALVVAAVWLTRGPARAPERSGRVASAMLLGMVLSEALYAILLPGPIAGFTLLVISYLLTCRLVLATGLAPLVVVSAASVAAYVAVLPVAGLPPPVVAVNAGIVVLVGTLLTIELAATRRRRLQQLYRRQLNGVAFALASRFRTETEDLAAAVGHIVELAATALGVTYAQVWRVDDERSAMRCITVHCGVGGVRAADAEIRLRDHPRYASGLDANPLVERYDAGGCPHVAGAAPASVLEAAVRIRGRTGAVLCFQHVGERRWWTGDEGRFASYMAHLVALAMEASERTAAEAALRHAVGELERRSAELSDTVEILNEHIAERRKVERELRESQAQLRALSTRRLQVQEDERRRIAREIHDELGQTLTALRIDLDWLGRRLEASAAPQIEKVERMAALVDRTVDSVQAIARNLRPPLLDDVGLTAALEWQAREFEARTGISCGLSVRCDDASLDADRSIAVFRVVQEALTNVARHARATRVKIGLEESRGRLVIRVRDNGCGIRREQARDPGALGLVGMRERVHLWGGRLRVEGRPGKGTVLRAELPLAERAAKQSGGFG